MSGRIPTRFPALNCLQKAKQMSHSRASAGCARQHCLGALTLCTLDSVVFVISVISTNPGLNPLVWKITININILGGTVCGINGNLFWDKWGPFLGITGARPWTNRPFSVQFNSSVN